MSAALERRYRRLLLAYPAAYRRERGAEILDTLLESAAPGQRRPGAREVAALLLGGLRVRAGAHRQRRPADVWLGGLRYAGVVVACSFGLDRDPMKWVGFVSGMPLLAVTVLALRRLPAVRHPWWSLALVPAMALAMRMSVLVPLDWLHAGVLHPVLLGAALLGALFDARITIGVAGLLLYQELTSVPIVLRFGATPADLRWYAIVVGAILVPLGLLGAWQARRQAAL